MTPVRVVLAHAHGFFRHGVTTYLHEHTEFHITASVRSGHDTLTACERTRPDLLVLALELDGMSGLEVARATKRQWPTIGMVAVDDGGDPATIIAALRAGIAAVVPSTIEPCTLLPILRAVRRGAYPINDDVLRQPALAQTVLAALRSGEDELALFSPLGAREIEVLELVAAGRSNKEIASALHIAVPTVKTHMVAILRKLQVNDRMEAVLVAIRKGWIKV